MNLRIWLARAILPRYCVVVWREDLEDAAELAETAYGRVPAHGNWAGVNACLDRAEWRCK